MLESLRPTPAATEGFLLQPSPGLPTGYVATRISAASPSVTVATSRCETAGDASNVMIVTAVTGPRPAAFAALLETAASAASSRRGNTMFFVDGTRHAEAEAALNHIRDATPAQWARYRTRGETRPEPTTPPTTG